MIFLLCSFAELTFDYDYSGLATFMPIVDECIFFDSGLSKESISKINESVNKPIEQSSEDRRSVKWYKYEFTDFCTMRNDLIKKARKRDPNSWVIMIDDCYSTTGNLQKEEIERCDADLIECDFECSALDANIKPFNYICPKIFRANSFDYILRVHEILIPRKPFKKFFKEGIKIFDISDSARSYSRTLRDIEWMKSDLKLYYYDNFIRAHLSLYMADALLALSAAGSEGLIIGKKEEAIHYYRVVKQISPVDHAYYERAALALSTFS